MFLANFFVNHNNYIYLLFRKRNCANNHNNFNIISSQSVNQIWRNEVIYNKRHVQYFRFIPLYHETILFGGKWQAIHIRRTTDRNDRQTDIIIKTLCTSTTRIYVQITRHQLFTPLNTLHNPRIRDKIKMIIFKCRI